MKINYSNDAINVIPTNVHDVMNMQEMFELFNLTEQQLRWHELVTGEHDLLADTPAFKQLNNWGVTKNEELLEVQHILKGKRKRYLQDMTTIQEVRDSEEYKQMLLVVEEKFGGVLNDGTSFFEYQKEDIAMISIKKRSLCALEMGLGKTRTSIAGVTIDPNNKKILIITMSRNLNDWMGELENLGFGDDYILLNHPNDLHIDKRIHLVSYEKWSNESGRTIYRNKERHCCNICKARYRSAFFRNKGLCYRCKATSLEIKERWSDKDKPKFCPSCQSDWKKGANTCSCNYSLVESSRHSLSDFYHHGYDACIIDEAHLIKNGESRRSQAVRKVRTPVKVALSGTPAENGTEDLYFILGWLTGFSSRYEDPQLAKYGGAQPFDGFGKAGLKRFTEYYGGGSKRAVLDIDSIKERVSNHTKLWAVLDTLMIRRKKTDDDVKKDAYVPEPIHHRYHIKMQVAEAKLYNDILEDFSEWYRLEKLKKEAAMDRGESYRINTILICAWLRKLQQAASCPWVFENYDTKLGVRTAKMEFLENKVVENIRKGQKCLVFSGMKESVETLALSLDNMIFGKEAAYIHGGVKKEDRWKLIKRFQDPNDPLMILVLSHKTGAESYTLTQAKSVYLFDLDFNGKRMEQCYSRAVRLTQTDAVDVWWLMNMDTIDCNIHGLNLSKISGVDKAIDRVELDMKKIAEEFEGDTLLAATAIDYEAFAVEMLKAGTKRQDYENVS